MKFKNSVKSILTTYLCIIAICLYIVTFIGYSKKPLTNLSSSLSNQVLNESLDYKILDKNEYSDQYCYDINYFYEKNGNLYYLNCANKDNIYIEWSNGKITTLLDGINNDNLDIDYLIKYKGLKAYKDEYNGY